MQNKAANSFNPLKQALIVAITGFGLWALLAYPAYLATGIDGLKGITIAAFICTIPGILVSLMGTLVTKADQLAILLVIGGLTLRMVFVLIGILMVNSLLPGLQFWDFTIWVIAFYLVLLAVETFLAYKQVMINSCVIPVMKNDSGPTQETLV